MMFILKIIYNVLDFFSSFPRSELVWLIVDEILGPVCAGVFFSLIFDAFVPIFCSNFLKSFSTLYIFIKQGGFYTSFIKILNSTFLFFYSKLSLINVLGLFFGIIILPFIIFCIVNSVLKLLYQINNTLSMIDDGSLEDTLEEDITEVETNTEDDFPLDELSDYFDYLSFILVIIVLIFES
jgi:hypothetical protein